MDCRYVATDIIITKNDPIATANSAIDAILARERADIPTGRGYPRSDWIVYAHPQGLFALSHPPEWKASTDLEFGACLRLDLQINQVTHFDVFVCPLPQREENPTDNAALDFSDRLNQAIAKEGPSVFRVRGPFNSPLNGRPGRRILLDHLEQIVVKEGQSVSTTVDFLFVSAGSIVVVLVFEAATTKWQQFRPVIEGVLESLQLPDTLLASSALVSRRDAGEKSAHGRQLLPGTSWDTLAEVLTKRAMYFYHFARCMSLMGSALLSAKSLVDHLGKEASDAWEDIGEKPADELAREDAGRREPDPEFPFASEVDDSNSSGLADDSWYILPKGRKKEGPLTLDQLRQVVPAPGLRIRRTTDSDWCSWANIAERYPELIKAGLLQPTTDSSSSTASPKRGQEQQAKRDTPAVLDEPEGRLPALVEVALTAALGALLFWGIGWVILAVGGPDGTTIDGAVVTAISWLWGTPLGSGIAWAVGGATLLVAILNMARIVKWYDGSLWSAVVNGALLLGLLSLVGYRVFFSGAQPEMTFQQGNFVSSIDFSPDGTLLLTAGPGGVKLWDVQTGQQIGSAPVTGTIPVGAFGRDGKTIVTLGDPHLTVWSIDVCKERYQAIAQLRLADAQLLSNRYRARGEAGNETILSLSDDGEMAVTGSRTAGLLWHLPIVKRIGIYEAPKQDITCIVLAPTGGMVYTGYKTGNVELGTIPGNPFEIRSFAGLPLKHPVPVLSIAVNNNARYLAIATQDKVVRVWTRDLALLPKEPLGPPLPHPHPVRAMAFSPDEKRLLTSCDNEDWDNRAGEFRLWDVASAKTLGTYRQRGSGAVAFAPDGKMFATGDDSGVVKLWIGAKVSQLCHSRHTACFQGNPAFSALQNYRPDPYGKFRRSKYQSATEGTSAANQRLNLTGAAISFSGDARSARRAHRAVPFVFNNREASDEDNGHGMRS